MSRHLRYRRLSSDGVDEPTINLTPLIDVVFVILIMFILIAPLLEIDKVELADAGVASNDTSLSEKEKSPISIHVDKDDKVTFNSHAVSIERLGDVLKEAHRLQPKVHPQLFHDRRASFGTYQSVKNAVEAAGFDEMDVVLKPS